MLTTVAEDLFAQNQFDLAIAVGQAVIAKQPPVEPQLARTAWTVVAHSHFDLENYADAETAYYSLRGLTPVDDADATNDVKERIASSIYKQGEQARDSGDLETAVAHFTRLGQAVPDSNIRATAEYDAAAALINLAAWDRATGMLEQYRRNYPDSEFADDISQKLAVTYMETGRGAQAAAEFERIAVAESSSDEVRREALWKAAELYETGGVVASEKRVLEVSSGATRTRCPNRSKPATGCSRSPRPRVTAQRSRPGCMTSLTWTLAPERNVAIAPGTWQRKRRCASPSRYASASRWCSSRSRLRRA